MHNPDLVLYERSGKIELDFLFIFVVFNPVLACLFSIPPYPSPYWFCVFVWEYIQCENCELSGIAGGHIFQCVLAVHPSGDEEVPGGLSQELSLHSSDVFFQCHNSTDHVRWGSKGVGGREIP